MGWVDYKRSSANAWSRRKGYTKTYVYNNRRGRTFINVTREEGSTYVERNQNIRTRSGIRTIRSMTVYSKPKQFRRR